MKALVVDDSKLMVTSVAKMVAAMFPGCEVATARDGHEGLAQARAMNPDLAVLDVNMPGMDGVQLLQALKAEIPKCRVVIYTASEDDRVRAKCLALGASGFVQKKQELLKEAITAAFVGSEDGALPSRTALVKTLARAVQEAWAQFLPGAQVAVQISKEGKVAGPSACMLEISGQHPGALVLAAETKAADAIARLVLRGLGHGDVKGPLEPEELSDAVKEFCNRMGGSFVKGMSVVTPYGIDVPIFMSAPGNLLEGYFQSVAVNVTLPGATFSVGVGLNAS